MFAYNDFSRNKIYMQCPETSQKFIIRLQSVILIIF